MGVAGKRQRFFSYRGIELPQQQRPSGVRIPKEHTGIYYIWTAIKANVGITYWDVKNGRVGWGDIFAVMDGERLIGWLEWEQHVKAEQESQNRKRG